MTPDKLALVALDLSECMDDPATELEAACAVLAQVHNLPADVVRDIAKGTKE